MTPRFTRRFRTRFYELDALGHIEQVTLIQYMQEAAIEASAALGLIPDWYREQGTLWVVRRLFIRYFDSATYGDEVEILTWISGMRGVRSTREYDLSRVRDGVRLARARIEWVYVEAQTGQPIRCPEEWAAVLPKAGKLEDLGIHLSAPVPTDAAHRYIDRRRVQFHEVDGAQHVNHAVYLRWAAEALRNALRAAGYPVERSRHEGWAILSSGHEVQYFAPALDNDNIEMVSWVCELGDAGWAWTHEAYNADSRQLLARIYSASSFVTLDGALASLPRQAIEDILHGSGPDRPEPPVPQP